jgi:hypothetical protein
MADKEAPKEAPKTEIQKGEEKQAEAVDKANAKSADVLTAAAASGDAAVHNLLGERVIAEQNQDTESLKEIDKKLADLVG